MLDRYGRAIDYMRISVTDRCNLRCRYCMPDGTVLCGMDELLTFEEIARAAKAAASCGIRHVRVTGGEPLVRRSLPVLIRMLKDTPGIEKVTMTTNGTLLKANLESLMEAGLDGVNISLDTLDRTQYEQLTGTDALEDVLTSVDAAVDAHLPVKINAVSLAFPGEHEKEQKERINALAEFAFVKGADVRFIELMPVGCGKNYTGISHTKLRGFLEELWPDIAPDTDPHGFGPAVYYRIPGAAGSIGLISAISGKFCAFCNRIRLTSKGILRPCLCYDEGEDLRTVLRSDLPEEEIDERLRQIVTEVIQSKPRSHCFENEQGNGQKDTMNEIGG